jgi:hypothetical protein
MRIPSGKTDQYIYFVAYDSTDHVSRKTGLSAFTVYRSRNDGTASVYTTPTVAELSSGNMPGVYALLIDEDTTVASGSDSEEYCVHITCSGMDAVTRTIELYRRDTTSGRTLAITSGGNAGIDWANVASPTTSLALTGTTIATTQKVDVDTIKTNPVVNGGTITFPTTATLASTTNITAGTVTTATNVTTVNGLASGVITATSIAADAITAAKVADGTIDAATFATGAINAAAIAADAITAAKIADGAIDAATFAASAITATAIAADAITDAKVASDVTIASVTGAVGSVTGTVGSVTGNVGGNVTGSVGSVVGAVGSVTGNVGGNVTGSVGSITTGGIAAASFAAGAIDASAIATDALGALELAAGAASEIAAAVWDLDATAHQTQGTFGQAIGDPGADTDSIWGLANTNLDATVSSRLASGSYTAPDNSSITSIKTQTDKLAFTVTNQVDANVLDWKSATAPAMTGDAYARLGAPSGASVSADVAAVKSDSSAIKTKTDGLTFTSSGFVDANVQKVNDVTVTGTGASGDEWGP